ncbi:MAG: phage tail tape measure protein, partial [Pseudomonas sp.]
VMPAKPPAVPVPGAGVSALAGAAEAAGEANKLGRMVRSVRGVTRAVGKLPGGKLVDAVPGVLDVALNAETQDEKAEGYGGVAGGMAGAMAGAATGAAIGSIVPVIGTAVGGAIGAVLGGLGGESVGGWLGKQWFGEKKPEKASGQSGESHAGVSAEVPQADPAMAMPAPVVKGPEPVAKVPEPVPVALEPVSAPPTPAVSYDPLDPGSKDPFLVPALTANKVRFPGADLVKPALVEKPPEPVAMVPEPVPVALGPVSAPPTPAVSYDPLDPGSKDPFLVPALTANKVRFPGADLVKPAPVVKDLALREPQKVPQLPPAIAPVVSQAVKGGGESGAMGNVVRSLVASVQPPTVAKAVEKAKPEPAKVDQSFTFAPVMPIAVHGDVKDPNQIVREAEQALRVMFEGFQREVAARQASVSLFDAADVA